MPSGGNVYAGIDATEYVRKAWDAVMAGNRGKSDRDIKGLVDSQHGEREFSAENDSGV